MANPFRGEVALVVDGEARVMRLTLGALGDAFGLRAAYWLIAVGAALWLAVGLKLRRLAPPDPQAEAA